MPSNVRRIATLLGRDAKSPLIAKIERATAAIVLGRQTYVGGKQLYDKYKKKLEEKTSYTLTIPATDEDLYDVVLAWLIAETAVNDQRHVEARGAKRRTVDDAGDSHKEPYVDLRYTGDYESTVVIDGYTVTIRKLKPGEPPKKKNKDPDEVSFAGESDGDAWGSRGTYVKGYGYVPAPERIAFCVQSEAARDAVHRFLERLLVEDSKSEKRFKPELMMASRYGRWNYHSAVHIRPLSSVVLREGQLEEIIADLAGFLDSEGEYRRRAIPWHRGYLFYGPPGTGKTSLAMGLANHFRMNLAYIPLGDLDKDSSLMELVTDIPNRSILLLEDIDTFGTATGRKKEAGASSLSALLNSLDGVGTPHGLVTIMTTNDINALDDALIRPGRTDRMEELTYVDAEQAARLFRNFYPDSGEDEARRVGHACAGMAPAQVLEVCKRHLDEPKMATAELTEHRPA